MATLSPAVHASASAAPAHASGIPDIVSHTRSGVTEITDANTLAWREEAIKIVSGFFREYPADLLRDTSLVPHEDLVKLEKIVKSAYVPAGINAAMAASIAFALAPGNMFGIIAGGVAGLAGLGLWHGTKAFEKNNAEYLLSDAYHKQIKVKLHLGEPLTPEEEAHFRKGKRKFTNIFNTSGDRSTLCYPPADNTANPPISATPLPKPGLLDIIPKWRVAGRTLTLSALLTAASLMTIKRGEVTEALQKETEAHLVDKTHTDYDSKYVDLLQAQKDSKTRIDGEQVIIDNPATGSLKKKDTIREQAREQIKLNEAKAQIASTEEKKLAQVGHLEHIGRGFTNILSNHKGLLTAGTLAHGVLDSLGLLLGPLSYLTAGRRANRKKKSDGEIADANGLHETIHASRKFAIAKDLARVQEEFATMMAALPANSRAKTWLTDIQSMNQIGDVAEMLRILNEKIGDLSDPEEAQIQPMIDNLIRRIQQNVQEEIHKNAILDAQRRLAEWKTTLTEQTIDGQALRKQLIERLWIQENPTVTTGIPANLDTTQKVFDALPDRLKTVITDQDTAGLFAQNLIDVDKLTVNMTTADLEYDGHVLIPATPAP